MSVQATTWVWEHAPVEGSALLVLLAVADAANREGGQSCQSVGTIAKMARVSERTAQRSLRALEESGVLVAEGTDPRYRTTRYRIPAVGDIQGREGDTQGALGVTSGAREGDTVVAPDPNKTPHTAPQQNTHTVAPLRAPVAASAEFDQFWAAYPRNTDKGAARTAWAKAVAKADAQTIIQAAQAFAAWNAQRRTESRFIPHPTTWLNRERWEDDLPAMTPAESRALGMANDVHQDGSWAETSDGGWGKWS